jgi:hypothetical protein
VITRKQDNAYIHGLGKIHLRKGPVADAQAIVAQAEGEKLPRWGLSHVLTESLAESNSTKVLQ